MSKVTSKLQVTIPKAIAERYGITPGDELEWTPVEGSVRLARAKALERTLNVEARIRLFDAATQRQRLREAEAPRAPSSAGRGWTREELYGLGSSG